MEENTVQNDRFYEEKKEMLEFAPEPICMNEAKRKGSFTVGEKYPILEKDQKISYYQDALKGSSYKFKTIDDKGTEIWIDEAFFIPAERVLTFDKTESATDCEWTETSPDIRKMAEEQGVERWDVESDCISSKNAKYPIKDVNTLAGIRSDDEVEGKNSQSCYSGSKCNIAEGVVKDDGNDMMYDADKCLAAISKIFGNNDVIDPDDIINSIRKMVHGHLLTWQDGYLAVDDAKTKISYEDVKKAYSGLKTLVSARIAEKTVSNLIAHKLRKLF